VCGAKFLRLVIVGCVGFTCEPPAYKVFAIKLRWLSLVQLPLGYQVGVMRRRPFFCGWPVFIYANG